MKVGELCKNMGKHTDSVKNFLFYSGLTKDEFNEIKESFHESSIAILRVVSFCCGIFSIGFGAIAGPFLGREPDVYLFSGILYLLIAVLASTVAKGKYKFEKGLSYFFAITSYAYGMHISAVGVPNSIAILFIAIIIIVPVIFNERPIVHLNFMIISCVTFCLFAFKYKPYEIACIDLADVIVFAFMSIAISSVLSRNKAKGFLNGKRLKDNEKALNEAFERQEKEHREWQHQLDLRMKTVSEAIHGGFKISRNDPDFSFILVSEQLAKLLGYDSPKDLIEASNGCMANLVNREDAKLEIINARASVDSDEMYTMHYRVRCKDGSWKNVEDRGRLIVNEKGVGEFWSFIIDQDLLAELEAANEAKSTFLFNMSHDIRTPMNAILGYSKLIKNQLTDPILLDYQSKIEQSGNLLLSIINNVLDMARIESGKMELDESYTSSNEVLREIVSVFEPDAKRKRIKLSLGNTITNGHIMCDKTKVKEIILNLLSNAIKYTPEGGEVKVTCQEVPCDKPGHVRFKTTVSDTGIGMSREYIPRMFDSFSRERNTTIGKISGTGLGMAIVKKLVGLMNGEIYVDSIQGKGTTISVVLEHRVADEAYYEMRKADLETRLRQDLKGLKVLLAEDNELNAEIAVAILSDMGLDIDRVEDGVQCVAKLEKEVAGYYDLVLMDIQMPNMNGYKATQVIRALPDLEKASIPIVAMTANAFDEDKKNAFKCGMDGHLAKPINEREVVEELSRVIKQREGKL